MKQLNLKHSSEYLDQFIRYGKEIRKQANLLHIQHPTQQHITTVDDILFVDDPAFPGDTYKSLVFLGEAVSYTHLDVYKRQVHGTYLFEELLHLCRT